MKSATLRVYFNLRWWAWLSIFSGPAGAKELAKVSLHCLSIRCDPVVTNFGGVSYQLAFGILERLDMPPSGELRPGFEDSIGTFKSLRGFYQITSPRLTSVASDDFSVNLPRLVDRNGNGIYDFYEVSEAVDEIAKINVFEAPEGGGTVEAAWFRPANSSRGVVSLHLISAGLNSLDTTFKVPFQILEYSGTLDYRPGDPSITAETKLVSTDLSNAVLSGPFNFSRIDSDFLAAVAGVWTNSARGKVAFQAYISDTNQTAVIGRIGSKYEGLLAFDEGSLRRGDSVVYDTLGNIQPIVWDLLISDTNDFDGNGIPDFSDTNSPPELQIPPNLTVEVFAAQVELNLTGQSGRSYAIESATDLAAHQWMLEASVTLLSDQRRVSIPLPISASTFWRARVLP